MPAFVGSVILEPESPYAHWPSLDAAAQSFGGLVHANDNGYTCRADVFPGTLMAFGAQLRCIMHTTGVGQFLDVAMYDAMLGFRKAP